MQMISFIFFGFVTIVYLLLYSLNKIIKDSKKSNCIANWILLATSYLFVAYADYRFALALAILTLSTWFFARNSKINIVGIIIALVMLSFFKYTNFFASSFASLLGNDFTVLNIILPIGISFYTFNAISYLVDVKREKLETRNLKDVALYLSFFPKLTSGPLQKSGDFFEQADRKREIGWNTFSLGIQVFMFGLFKKIVLADRLSVFVNQVYETPNAFGSLTVFIAAIAYSLQIYFDFSGYSDMAIGVARIIGFKLPRNFNLPYLAHNVTELWKRWHITLSSWLQEYLYISLGGNRKGKFRTYFNLVLTMVLGGIWHGANWSYLIWGLLHGIALAIHKAWVAITGSPGKKHSVMANVVSIVLTFMFTSFCWIFFRADSFNHAITIIRRIVSFESGIEQPYIWLFISIIVLFVCSMAALIKSKKLDVKIQKMNISFIEGYYPILDLTKFLNLVAFFVFCGLILCLAYTGGSPFIYGNY